MDARKLYFEAQTEADYQKKITDYCDLHGLKWHHETDSRKSKKGWPDLVIAGHKDVIFVEVKKEKGTVTLDQKEWLEKLKSAGATTYIWRPSDWVVAERILKRLARDA
jgi:hypothetical protein